jgi:hypothetical protein
MDIGWGSVSRRQFLGAGIVGLGSLRFTLLTKPTRPHSSGIYSDTYGDVY